MRDETGIDIQEPGAKATGKMVPQGTRSSDKFLKKSHRMDSGKKTSGFIRTCKEYFLESLILAQDERWRRA